MKKQGRNVDLSTRHRRSRRWYLSTITTDQVDIDAIANDWVVRHEGRYLQLRPGQRRYGPTQSKALVCEWKDGLIEVHYRKQRGILLRTEGANTTNRSAHSARQGRGGEES